MKYLLIILLILSLNACEVLLPRNWDSDPDRVLFCTRTEEDDTFLEIRIYGKEMRNDTIVAFDSTIFNARNLDGTDETFSRDRGACLTFIADSLVQIKNGWFEAVALRKDSVLLQTKFGQIWNGNTHRDYKVTLTKSIILVEDQ